LHKHNSYFFIICGLAACLFFTGCKTSASVTGKDKGKKGLDEKTQIIFENLYIDGCSKRLSGKIEEAEATFRQCLKMDPSSIPVKYELANLYRLTGRVDESLAFAKECLEADPKNQWYHLSYIDGLTYKKEYLKAAEAFERLIKIYPGRSDFMESMAISYAMGQNFSKAFKIYEDLEKRYGTNETFIINKIKLLKEQGKLNEAEQELKKLISTNPSESRYHYYLAEHYEDTKQFNKAKEVYDKILSIDPGSPLVHLALANYYKEQNNAEKAHEEFKLAFANPDLGVRTKLDILLSYYSISEQYSNYIPKGYELCEIMLKVHPVAPEAHSIYADFLYRDKKNEEARDHYLIAAYNDKNRYAIWDQLLNVEAELNQIDSLEHHSATAMELFPNQPLPYYLNGYSNIQLKKYNKAIESFNDGLEFVYDNKKMMLEFYSNLGDAYQYTGQFEKSDKAYEDALKIDPDNAYVLNNYSYYLSLRKEKLERAEALSKRSNQISPNNPSFIDTYAWILYQQKKYKESEEWLSLAIKLGSKRPGILEHYGDVLFRLNKVDEAIKYWKLAQDNGAKSDELQKKINDKKIND